MNRRKLSKIMNISKCFQEFIGIVSELAELEEEQNRNRRYAVRPVNRDRTVLGFYQVSFLNIKDYDPEHFFKYTRMNKDQYFMLLAFFKPLATKHSFNDPVEPECRLAVLLLYLSQGSTIQQLAWQFKLGKETVRQIILESSSLMWENLHEIYVSVPNIVDYKDIRNDFWNMWNMPNCLGAVDGKHIAITCPNNTGTQFHNYKGFFSIVLMAACDAKYRFTHVDLGSYGSHSDGGIFQHSTFGRKIINGTLEMPTQKKLPKSNIVLPIFLLELRHFHYRYI